MTNEELISRCVKLVKEMYQAFQQIKDKFYDWEKTDAREREEKFYKARISELNQEFKCSKNITDLLISYISDAAFQGLDHTKKYNIEKNFNKYL